MTSRLRQGSDRMFLWLFLAQWVFAIALAVGISPYTYDGVQREVHLHVWIAVVFGGIINALPLWLIVFRPGWWFTRHTIAAVQMLWFGLLITVTAGRFETHFHIFASLAFLALYRDWKILPTATMVVVVDHLIRSIFWPDSLYGVNNPEWWTLLEHVVWIVAIDVALSVAIVRSTVEMRQSAAREARLERSNTNIEAKVRQRTVQLQDSARRYRSLVENTDAIALEYDMVGGELLYIAPQATRMFDCSVDQLTDRGFLQAMLHPDDLTQMREDIARRASGIAPWSEPVDVRFLTKHGRTIYIRMFMTFVPHTTHVRAIALDITRQRQLELELQQAQKLESVGRLAAGVAHEINTPIQFIGDSVVFMASAFKDVAGVLGLQADVVNGLLAAEPNHAGARAAADAADQADLAYILAEAPSAADRALEGVDRVSTIVRSMKVFAHPDSERMESVDLNDAITTTLTIARNEYRYVADLETHLGAIPPVTCFVGEVNQAVLNILINASHAISDVHAATTERGKIEVTTTAADGYVEIAIRDTGGGIADRVRDRVFDPFFTTKAVGKGTGQGLSMARAVIVERHKGGLRFETQHGLGTTFFIRLPVDGHASNVPAAA